MEGGKPQALESKAVGVVVKDRQVVIVLGAL
jgi:hypothetical protein